MSFFVRYFFAVDSYVVSLFGYLAWAGARDVIIIEDDEKREALYMSVQRQCFTINDNVTEAFEETLRQAIKTMHDMDASFNFSLKTFISEMDIDQLEKMNTELQSLAPGADKHVRLAKTCQIVMPFISKLTSFKTVLDKMADNLENKFAVQFAKEWHKINSSPMAARLL